MAIIYRDSKIKTIYYGKNKVFEDSSISGTGGENGVLKETDGIVEVYDFNRTEFNLWNYDESMFERIIPLFENNNSANYMRSCLYKCIGPFQVPFNALKCRYRLQVSVSEVAEGYTEMRDTTHGQENILLVFSNKKEIDLSTTRSTSYATRAYAYYNHAHAEIGVTGYHAGNHKYLYEKGEARQFQPLEGSVAENYGDL